MSLNSVFSLDFGSESDMYYKLLSEEDFNFKTKDIVLKVDYTDKILVNIECSSIIEMKIATSALIKSLEVIEKTLNV